MDDYNYGNGYNGPDRNDEQGHINNDERSADAGQGYSYNEEYRRSPEQREAESSYTSDGYRMRYDGGDRNTGSNERSNPYAYGSDDTESRYRARYTNNNGGGGNRKKGHGKTILAVIAAALVLGGVVGAGCWAVGSYVGGSNSSAVESSTEQETAIAKEAIPSQAEEAQGETEAASAAAAQPSQESEAAGSSVVTPGSSAIPEADTSTSAATGTVKALDVTEVVDVAMPAVVSITTKTVYENYSTGDFNPFYYYFYGYDGSQGGSATPYEVTGAGSGIIIGDDGTELWVVTNNHVVEGADTLNVTFADDTNVEGYIKGTDSKNDLAVVGVKIADLSETTLQAIASIKMGDSDSLKLGETVIAIGNALGLGQSVSTGVVSAMNREITTSDGNTLNTIQTDAAINPGNSGGALLDANGELIGINVAKDAETEVEGMGYAIPISSAKEIIANLTTMTPREEVSEEDYPYMGVQLNDVSASVAQTYGIPEGVMVYSIEENSPAKACGMLEQDVITEFNGVAISTYDDLVNELKYCAGGSTVTLKVMRVENGSYQEKELTMTLGYKKDVQSQAGTGQNEQQQDQNGQQQNGQQQNGQQQNENGWDMMPDNGGSTGFPGFNFGN